MEINELVFYDRLCNIQKRLLDRYFRVTALRPKDYDKEKRLEEYGEFAEYVYGELVKLNELLGLVQPDPLESALSLFMGLFKDELIETINAKNRTFPLPPTYGRTVKKPDLKAESTAVE